VKSSIPGRVKSLFTQHGTAAPEGIDARVVIHLGSTFRHIAVMDDSGAVWLLEAPYMSPTSHPATTDWIRARPVQAIGACKLGSLRYPEVAQMLPPRPTTAPDCTDCNGTGSDVLGFPCSECFGLGWIPSG